MAKMERIYQTMSEFLIDQNTLVKYTGTGGEVVVPDGVVAIGEYAFSASNINGVKLPKSLKRIEKGVFQGCGNLRIISIPSTVTSIGAAAFKGCVVETLELPSKLSRIPQSAFECSKLCEITLPKAVKTIPAINKHQVIEAGQPDDCTIARFVARHDRSRTVPTGAIFLNREPHKNKKKNLI